MKLTKYSLILLSFTFCISCSSSSQNDLNESLENNSLTTEENLDTEDTEENSNNEDTEENLDTEDTEENSNNEDTEENLDKDIKEQEIKAMSKYSISSKIFYLFENHIQEFQGINKDTILSLTYDFSLPNNLYYDRRVPYVMSYIDNKQSVDKYKDKFFNDFITIGRIKLISDNIEIKEIKGYAAYIDANLIIMKKLFDNENYQYIYDIMFLQGNIDESGIYWLRNHKESKPLEDSLKELNITNINDYSNIITYKLIQPDRNLAQKVTDYTNPSETITEQDLGLNLETITEEDINNTDEIENLLEDNSDLQEENNIFNSISNEDNLLNSDDTTIDLSNTNQLFSEEDLQILSEQASDVLASNKDVSLSSFFEPYELYELQKSLITFRVNAVIGLWENVITGELIEIREIISDNEEDPIRYGGYILHSNPNNIDNTEINEINQITASLNSLIETITFSTPTIVEESKVLEENNLISSIENEYTTRDTIKVDEILTSFNLTNPYNSNNFVIKNLVINNDMVWNNRDLKLDFYGSGGPGIFINSEKMVEDVNVFLHPAKGLMVVALPNNQYKYYRPYIEDIMPQLNEALYDKNKFKQQSSDKSDLDNIRNPLYNNKHPEVPSLYGYLAYPGITITLFTLFLLIFM